MTNDTSSIVMYPNPTQSNITISGASNALVNIIDASGKLLLTQEILNDNETIDLSAISSGVYYVQINSVQGAKVMKLIKQ